MSQIVIATRYAKALLNLAEKDGSIESVDEDLSEVVQTFNSSEELQSLFADPKVLSSDKRNIVLKILEKLQLRPLVHTFIEYLLSKKRIELLAEIQTVFSSLVREKMGILNAEITVAKELPESTISDIKQKLSNYSGKDVHVRVKIDNSIIGGVVTRIGSVVIDGSLRNQLARVYQSIIRG
ncbi:MAG: ATP synthase F1 subunit delta [SAR324 cluster bacterium]|nr:ATP synthase F1 subunit delta [SAR324 cluster bacterium]